MHACRTPTLGQSFESFVLQVAGSGIGYVVAVISECFLRHLTTDSTHLSFYPVLEIFKNVGGHVFNP